MDTPFGGSPQDLNGLTVVDGEGHKIGSVQRVYKDDASGAPEWVTVRTGLFGSKETFVPLADARKEDDKLRVPYTKERIKDAPRIEAESHLDAAEENDLYRYYGRTRPGTDTAAGGMGAGGVAGGISGNRGTAGTGGEGRMGGGPRHAAAPGPSEPMAGAGAGAGPMAMSRGREDTSAKGEGTAADAGTGKGADTTRGAMPDTESHQAMAEREMTLSEERVDIGTEEYESGHARLSKHVVTEEVKRTVPVSHEEVHVTREKLTGEEARAGQAGELKDGQIEITLHEERPVVSKTSVPYERVRIETERVTEQREVSTEVRKEEAEFDDGTQGTRGARGKGEGEGGTGRKGPGEFR
ncbi:PRC and DUF2382 domain-containing protein [Streptomyces sp. HNM0574]|uniref:PRC and DUF2382 domain-containing protein n=1 Tax=Streptomyces sp. HNM0574 TaxID=2714954 RepID=UPI00146DF9BF|nr:PRC and DUF2382 domain-containing protein [Streptomyces sp. HNM0574]NLU70841.1 PRC and DUF2382 domain-containing protein [Streptomyces sp. HNM0574]